MELNLRFFGVDPGQIMIATSSTMIFVDYFHLFELGLVMRRLKVSISIQDSS
jgi:hypothetical protein